VLAATWFVAYSAVLPLTQAEWGLSSRDAVRESLRLTAHALWFTLGGWVLILVVGGALSLAVTLLSGEIVTLVRGSAEVSTLLFAALVALGLAVVLPLVRAFTYAFYRSLLAAKGGRRE